MSHGANDENLWSAPQSDLSWVDPSVPAQKPGVVTWFKVYCGFMMVFGLLVIGVGVLMMFLPQLAPDAEIGPAEAMLLGVMYLVVGVIMLLPFGSAFFLPRRPWVWIYNLVLICLGLTGCLTLPFCIALLIFWIKPEVKAYYGKF